MAYMVLGGGRGGGAGGPRHSFKPLSGERLINLVGSSSAMQRGAENSSLHYFIRLTAASAARGGAVID